MDDKVSTYDIIVIGGGATGSAIALDASLRGLSILLLEQNDFAEGTSSRSTKLVHGGVRYLEAAITRFDKEQFSLVKEGLKERYALLKNASHLSRKIKLLTPLYHWYEIPYIYAGLTLYDLISGKYRIGKSSLLSKKDTLSKDPYIKKEGLKGAVSYYDGAFLDARMVIALLQSAEDNGAVVKNYFKVQDFIYDDNNIVGVKAYDKIDKKYESYFATSIINATGAFSDGLRKIDNPSTSDMIRPSRGIHIVVDKKFLPSNEGIMIPKTDDGRVLFMLPFLDKCLIGTTDNEGAVEENPKIQDSEIEYLLRHINRYFDILITKKDILSSFCGFRPLVNYDKSQDSSRLVREHIIETSKSGLISIAGGKWTTYRKMAQECVDRAINDMKLDKKIKECSTLNYKVVGSQKDIKNIEKKLYSYTENKKLIKRLLSLYGDRAEEILHIAKEESLSADIEPIYNIIEAEIAYTVRYEYVKNASDFLERRSLLSQIDQKSAKKIQKTVEEKIKKFIGL